MLKSAERKSWKKVWIICWIVILFFSSGQIMAQELIAFTGQDNKLTEDTLAEETAILSDPELEVSKRKFRGDRSCPCQYYFRSTNRRRKICSG